MDEQASTALEGPLNHHVPFRSRVVVFDFDKKSLEVANEKKINKGLPVSILCAHKRLMTARSRPLSAVQTSEASERGHPLR